MRSLAGRQTRVARRWQATTAAAGHARRHASAVAPVAPVAPVPRSFEKILIANRGEIACRVIRTARALGIRTVAVYSDADAGSMHVQMADEAYHIGGNAATDSYLKGDTILEVAQASGAQAVHPGYGFLSENAAFASEARDAGIVFIGPPVDAIVAMGSKSESKNIMEASGVSCVPGYHGDAQDLPTLTLEAERVGYPLMIKAILGGGGKGMRVVHTPADFEEQLGAARREAMASFKDDRVLLERYLTSPRHVELQVFADQHGGCVYLFERDCSLQRRHQKVIEEAPAPNLSAAKRAEMGAAAVAAARAVGYEGAGTVEFLLDSDGSFFFMEMNTRLQVEHPITEAITGQDLVEWQLKVAAGSPLPLQQDELTINGHAVEARIYAENPEKGFLPGSGRLAHLRPPVEVGGVRVDTGVRQGDEVSVFYDPMIAKLVVHAADRPAALSAMRTALAEYQVAGLPTNLNFCDRLIAHPAFAAADLDINFIEKHNDSLFAAPPGPPPQQLALAALASVLHAAAVADGPSAAAGSPWSSGGLSAGWRAGGGTRQLVRLAEVYSAAGTVHEIEVATLPAEAGGLSAGVTVTVGGESFELRGGRLELGVAGGPESHRLTATLSGTGGEQPKRVTLTVARHTDRLSIWPADGDTSEPAMLQIRQPESTAAGGGAAGSGGGAVSAPMPGKVVKVVVEEGQEVEEGEPLLIMEAMKMEHTLRAPKAGKVVRVSAVPGAVIGEEDVLIELE